MLKPDTRIFEEMTVPIEKAACYSDLQMRVVLPQRTINQYAELMRSGSIFPPLDCAEVEGELLVYDGFLRKAAYQKNGTTTIKVRVTKAEDREQAILWAVQAQAHEGLKRSNADKEFSVKQLLETERGKIMSAVEIARMAGVGVAMVARYRRGMESSGSIIKDNSEPSKRPKSLEGKVITGRGLRPKTYRTKKKREVEHQGRINPVPGPIKWPSREERGMVSAELGNQPHPDHPGLTYDEVHVRERGKFVQLFPDAVETQKKNEAAVREIVGLVRDIGAICQKFVAVSGKLSPVEIVMTLEAMKDGGRKVWARNLNQYRAELVQAIPIIEALLKATEFYSVEKNPPTV